MSNLFKKLAHVVAAPVKGAVSLAKDPKKWAHNVGKSYEQVDDIALPAIGFALGGPAGAAAGSALARGVGDGKFNLGETAKSAAIGGAAGLGLQALGGYGGAMSKLGGLAKGAGHVAGGAAGKLAGVAKNAGGLVGNTLKNTFMKDGGLDLSKLAGVATGASALKGSADKRKGADTYNAANAALRQKMFDSLSQKPDYSALMERLTARPNYKF